jgi:hypothetical protein
MYSGLEALLTEASSGPGTNAALVVVNLLDEEDREEKLLLNNNCCCLFFVVVVFELDAKELDWCLRALVDAAEDDVAKWQEEDIVFYL